MLPQPNPNSNTWTNLKPKTRTALCDTTYTTLQAPPNDKSPLHAYLLLLNAIYIELRTETVPALLHAQSYQTEPLLDFPRTVRIFTFSRCWPANLLPRYLRSKAILVIRFKP